MVNKEFWKGKKVLVTGHTGFKGSWLCLFLNNLGAEISGYSLEPPTIPSLFNLCNINTFVNSTIADIRDFDSLLKKVELEKPEIIIHMAAQSLVRLSYEEPVMTYQTNIIGTINLLEAVRVSKSKSVRAIVNVTTDKCYENKEWLWPYREYEPMGGHDPYSSSKACSEIVTASYRSSFFNPADYDRHSVAIATARAGNVIGGGDWADDRLIPDFIRAIVRGEKMKIRSPYAIRPWQHVLEPLTGYLTLTEKLFSEGARYAEGWNFGPDDNDARNVEWITDTICRLWGEGASYCIDDHPQPHEASYLKLDCSKAKAELGWSPMWNIETALRSIVDWNKAWLNGEDVRSFSLKQIEEYFDYLIK